MVTDLLTILFLSQALFLRLEVGMVRMRPWEGREIIISRTQGQINQCLENQIPKPDF